MLRYVGMGRKIEGIPARHLSDAEVMYLADKLFRPDLEGELLRSGLYERVKIDRRQRANKALLPTSENKEI